MDSKHDLNSVMKSVRQFVKDYARAKGYALNPDLRERNKVIRGLAENQIKYDHRFCPSRKVTENPVKDLMNICPCVWHKQEIEMQGHCKCKLFWKIEKKKDVLEKIALKKSSMEKEHKTKKGPERKNKYGLGGKRANYIRVLVTGRRCSTASGDCNSYDDLRAAVECGKRAGYIRRFNLQNEKRCRRVPPKT